jgi:hypothetical protein
MLGIKNVSGSYKAAILTNGSHEVVTSFNFYTGSWYRMCATHSSGTSTLYINGTNYGTASRTYTTYINWILLGQNSSSTSFNFVGDMDEVRIYNRALNANEIQALNRL